MNLASRCLLSVGSASPSLPLLISAQSPAQPPAAPTSQMTTLRINANAATTPFPHFWEQTFGSGRAILSLRQDYREDLRTVKKATGFKSVRFHGIFMDDVGLYDPDRKPIKFAQMTNADVTAPGHRIRGSTTSPTSTRSTTACSPTASAPSSNSASCRRSWPPTPTRCTPSGTSRTSLRPKITRSGTA